jgi:hypothetical protein
MFIVNRPLLRLVCVQGADFMAVWKDGKEIEDIGYLQAGAGIFGVCSVSSCSVDLFAAKDRGLCRATQTLVLRANFWSKQLLLSLPRIARASKHPPKPLRAVISD